MIDVNPNHLETITGILAAHVPECEVRAFGSRVTWTSKDYSDLDLAVVGGRALDPEALRRMKEAFETSNLPFRVDVLDWHAISAAFRKVIEKKYEVVQKGKRQSLGTVGDSIRVESLHLPSQFRALNQNWSWHRLDDVCEGIFDCPHSTPKLVSLGPLIARTQDVITGVFRAEQAACVSEETYRERTLRAEPSRGDLLYSREGTYFGIAAEVPEHVRVCLGQRMVLIRPDAGVVEFSFLRQWLNSPVMASHIHGYRDGSVAERLNLPTIRSLPILLPPLAEQRAIANVLGTLDDKIELNRRMNETLEAMARALFKSWFVDFGPVRAKAEGRDTGLQESVTDVFPGCFEDSSLGEIPKTWRHRRLGELIELTRGTTYKGSLKDLPGPVLLGLASIKRNGGFRDDKLSTYGGDSPPTLVLGPGELYASLKDVTQSADLLGAVARVPRHIKQGRLTQDTVKMTFTDPSVSREIVYRSLMTEEYREFCRSHATGTTNLGLSRMDFLSYPIIDPGVEVRKIFDSQVEALEQRMSCAIAQCQTLAALRDALLPKLISGELRIKHAEKIVARAL